MIINETINLTYSLLSRGPHRYGTWSQLRSGDKHSTVETLNMYVFFISCVVLCYKKKWFACCLPFSKIHIVTSCFPSQTSRCHPLNFNLHTSWMKFETHVAIKQTSIISQCLSHKGPTVHRFRFAANPRSREGALYVSGPRTTLHASRNFQKSTPKGMGRKATNGENVSEKRENLKSLYRNRISRTSSV